MSTGRARLRASRSARPTPTPTSVGRGRTNGFPMLWKPEGGKRTQTVGTGVRNLRTRGMGGKRT